MDEDTPLQRSWLSAYGPIVALGSLLAVAVAVLFFTAKAVNQPPPAPTGPPPGGPPGGRPPGPGGIDSKTVYETVNGIVRKTNGDWTKVSTPDRAQLDKLMNGPGNGKMAFDRMRETLIKSKSLTIAPAKPGGATVK